MPYRIVYSPEAEDHMRALTARQQATIMATVDRQLPHQPTLETRNRKRMRPNPLATWELRVQDFRVFYDVDEAPEQVVNIRAVGLKVGNKVRLGNEEVES